MDKTTHDSATPAMGQQVMTATAFIHHDFDGVTKVFMPKRAATKEFLPNIYELPGGHIEFGENLLFGLQRELREELDMTISIGDSFAAFTYMNDIKGSHSIEVVYFATFVDAIAGIKLNPADHSGYDWFSKQDVLNRRREILPDADNMSTMYDEGEPDPEYLAILRGFDLLAGSNFNWGKA
ncbi:NUDIX hydrolase [Aeromicrobium sp.]|nr:NUDIX hydrolase [Candidatus Saccharibacteria bacterium]